MAITVKFERTPNAPGEGGPGSRRLWLIGFALVAIVVLLDPSITFDDDKHEEVDPGIPPAEFLYLDTDRVAAYLAQLEGGLAKREILRETLRAERSAELKADQVFGFGAKAQEERFIEREVTPTAASNYFRLLDRLEDSGEEAVRLQDLEERSVEELRELDEGRFVQIQTDQLISPDYIRPYLVVRQESTLAALFPLASEDPAVRSRVRSQREGAKAFARQVGPNPRMTFAIEAPLQSGASSGATLRYLLPMRYEQLTDERSLIKQGGGDFTVVGKIVRIFVGSASESPAYIDSPTRETWLQPLRQAPSSLVRRSTRKCESQPGTRPKRCLRRALRAQTEIPSHGAVIIPVAIYK